LEPITQAVAAKGLKAASKAAGAAAESFLSAVFGDPAREIGALLKDKISARRYMNLIAVVAKAQYSLTEAGVKPQTIPLKIIHPMLEQCSLEDDPALQEKWASLLANAADCDRSHMIYPPFGSILANLTSLQVLFLDVLHNATNLKMTSYLAGKQLPDAMAPFMVHELSPKELTSVYFEAVNTIAARTPTHDALEKSRAVQDWEFQVDLLEHHFGLVHSQKIDLPGREALAVLGYSDAQLPTAKKRGKRATTLATAESIKTTFYYLSQFGFRFVEACKFSQIVPAKHAARKREKA
jgi:hypothetical protein